MNHLLDQLQQRLDKAWEKSPEHNTKTLLGIKNLSSSDFEEIQTAIRWLRTHPIYRTYNNQVKAVLVKAGVMDD